MYNKADLIRHFYQWCIDNKHIVDIEVFVGKNSALSIPKNKIDEKGNIRISAGKESTSLFEIEEGKIFMDAWFGEEKCCLSIDIDRVNWIQDRETGQNLYVENKENDYVTGIDKVKGMTVEEIKNWIMQNSTYYTQLLGIENWYIKYLVIKPEDKLSIGNDTDITVCCGDCHASYEYKSATIRFFSSWIQDEDALKRLLVHELAHVATSSFGLYTRYFASSALCLESEKKIAKELERDVHELLATQIECIVLGKETNNIGITQYTEGARADEKLRTNCKKYGVTSHTIISDINLQVKTALEILEEEKKYDTDFWYKKYSESLDLSKKKKLENLSEKEKQVILERESDALESYHKKSKIIIPGEVAEGTYYHFKKIILLDEFKRKAA